MSRILLVDDSPHAQRMGERILSDEGYEVVTVSNADAALIRLEDVDPDVVVADTVMPGRTGYDVCQYVKLSPRHRRVRVILTAGVTETLDEEHCKRVECDATLRKPFEATALLATVRPLAEAAENDRVAAAGHGSAMPGAAKAAASEPAQVAPFITVVDAEQVRAAVTVALDAAMDTMVEEITRRVLATLNKKKPDSRAMEQMAAEAAPAPTPPQPATAQTPSAPPPPPARPVVAAVPLPAVPASGPAMPRIEAVRRVSPLKLRSGSILGLEPSRPAPPAAVAAPPDDSETPPPEE